MRKDSDETQLQLAEVAKRIRVGLAECSMTQTELADAIPVAQSAMSHYMTGKRAIPMPTLIRVAEVLGVKPSQLL